MLIHINGKEKEITEGMALDALLKEFDISTVGTAVEVNREVIPKRTYAQKRLKEGDVVEIIRMVGGG